MPAKILALHGRAEDMYMYVCMYVCMYTTPKLLDTVLPKPVKTCALLAFRFCYECAASNSGILTWYFNCGYGLASLNDSVQPAAMQFLHGILRGC